MTGDGLPDIVTGGATQIALLRGDGLGGFGAPSAIDSGMQVTQLSLIDIDKDGLKDIAISYKGGGIRLLQNRAGQSFVPFPLPDLTGRG